MQADYLDLRRRATMIAFQRGVQALTQNRGTVASAASAAATAGPAAPPPYDHVPISFDRAYAPSASDPYPSTHIYTRSAPSYGLPLAHSFGSYDNRLHASQLGPAVYGDHYSSARPPYAPMLDPTSFNPDDRVAQQLLSSLAGVSTLPITRMALVSSADSHRMMQSGAASGHIPFSPQHATEPSLQFHFMQTHSSLAPATAYAVNSGSTNSSPTEAPTRPVVVRIGPDGAPIFGF